MSESMATAVALLKPGERATWNDASKMFSGFTPESMTATYGPGPFKVVENIDDNGPLGFGDLYVLEGLEGKFHHTFFKKAL